MKEVLFSVGPTQITLALPTELQEWSSLYTESMLCHLLERYYLSLLRASVVNWQKRGLSEEEIAKMAQTFVPANLARRFQ